MKMDKELKAGREKYWSELTMEEKIERMRKEVKNLQRSIHGFEDSIQLLRLRHGHGGGEERGRGPGKDDVYF
jgi:hypothetical protein